MGIVRNFIDIIGITSENELPDKISGQIIEYSEVEDIIIPEHKQRVKNIFQIMIQVEVKSTRTINAPLGKIIIIDGIKKLKIIYEEKSDSRKASILNLELPYNTFFELERGIEESKDIKIDILDAYFQLLDNRRIYSHIVYMVQVNYNKSNAQSQEYVINMSDDSLENVETDFLDNGSADYMDEMLITGDSVVTFKRTPLNSLVNPNQNQHTNLIDIDSEYL
jgi:hypothetical protein